VAPPIFITPPDGSNCGIANSANDSYRTVLTSSGTGGCFCSAENFLAITPDGTRAYVMRPTQTNTTITAVNTATGSVVASIPLPYRAEDLTMSPNGANLYVAESVPGEVVAVISTATNTVTQNIPIGGAPNSTAEAMAINPAGTELAITQDTVVTMVNLTTNSVTANIPLNGSEGVTFSPNGATAYVTNGFQGGGGFGANTVSAISTASNTITRTYSGMTEPIAVTVTPDGTQLFVANVGTYNAGGGHLVTTPYVAVINTTSGTESNLMQATIPENVSVNPDGKSVYIADSASGQVGILNASTHALVGTIAVAGQPDTVKPFGDTAPPPPPPPPPLKVTTTTLPGAAQSVYYSAPLAATGGESPYSWSLSSGTLPTGLGLTPSGFITGTPSATATASTFTVKVADAEYPAATATATLTLLVAPASTAPPPCGGSAMGGYSPLHVPPNCVTASNTVTGGTASATSTSSSGTIAVTAHGTGGFTIGQTGTAPPDVPFRAASDAFDLDLSSSNTFTSITVVDCALVGATSLQWWNAAANGGQGAWQTVSPAVYNHTTHCLTITFSGSSSPTIAQLDGTTFAGVLPTETVTITRGGSTPYSITGSVLSGAITISQGQLITKVSGTVLLAGASGELVTTTVNTSCILGVCAGTFSVSDPQAGVSFTTPLTATVGQVGASAASGKGVALPGPGLSNSYPLTWSVSVADS
jgi:YVTN family beta-propeller protein